MRGPPQSAHTQSTASESADPTGDSRREPIAIVGIGCRLPGHVVDPESYWRLLRDAVDATSELPADRWTKGTFFHPEVATPGKTHCCRGGFLDAIDQFDAAYFGISPREAAGMDPQQRLLLEVACESLEDAGLPTESAARRATGVYVGLSGQDYALMQHNEPDLTRIDAHTNTGVAMSITANRISYCLNLHGPNLAIDTACSSSLVAVHLACQAIWNGDCQLALAGGAHILIKAEPYIGFSRMSMLSPTGTCKAFDASADGFARSEGAAMVVLKRLSDATRDGDRIYAVILGTGVNQDGRTSSLTVPSEDAQAELLRHACADAGISPSDLQYVEAHGTGTLVGDPIEARALARILSVGRSSHNPCVIGSVKTNIGHLEPASGIAGLVKAALSLQHRRIPANLHFQNPNPAIPFDELKLRVATELAPWPDPNRPLLAGVNSFGFGGTNAHVLLREAPQTRSEFVHPGSAPSRDDEPQVYVFSARNAAALRSYAVACSTALNDPAFHDPAFHDSVSSDSVSSDPVSNDPIPGGQASRDPVVTRSALDTPVPEDGLSHRLDLDDFRWTSAMRRNHYDERLAITASSRGELIELLSAHEQGESRAGISSGRAEPQSRDRLAFVFSGQGPQWWGMGRELLTKEPIFRDAIEECESHLAELADWSLIEELTRDERASRINETAIAQPAIFALQYGLARLFASWGIRPAAVVGHSVGEVAAACLAGTLTLPQAARVIFHRGRCMSFAGAHGRMLAVGVTPSEARGLLSGLEAKVSLAAINDPRSVTLSGDGAALESLAARLEPQGIFAKFLRVDYAFHSLQLDPMRSNLLAALDGLDPSEASLPLYSTVTGARCTGREMHAEYWWDNARRTVQFSGAAESLLVDGFDLFVEIAPHPVLMSSLLAIARGRFPASQVIPTLRRQEPERRQLLNAIGALYVRGFAPRWEALARSGRLARLPRYPWQRERHWSESRESASRRIGPAPHPLLGPRLGTAHGCWEQQIHLRQSRYLADHRVQGHAVLPATGFMEMALAANREFRGSERLLLEDVEFSRLCFLPEDEGILVQLVAESNETDFSIHSRPVDATRWTLHVRGKMRSFEMTSTVPPADLGVIRARCPRHVEREACYDSLRELGLDYGPAFRGIESLWIGSREALGRIHLDESLDLGDRPTDNGSFVTNPVILDTCFHVILGTLPTDGKYRTGVGGVFLPVGVESLRIQGPLARSVWSHARLVEYDERNLVVDVAVYSDDGELLVEAVKLRCQMVDSRGTEARELSDLVYQYRWETSALDGAPPSRGALIAPMVAAESIRADMRRLATQSRAIEREQAFDEEMAALCARYVWQAMRELGAELSPETPISTGSLMALGIQPHFEPLVDRYVVLLRAHDLLRTGNGEPRVAPDVDESDPQELWNRCLARHPAYYAQCVIAGRAGPRLADILRGEVDPRQTLFPDGFTGVLDQLYQDSPKVRLHHTACQSALAEAIEGWPRDGELRVLEIGGGIGGLTSYLLPELPAEGAAYVFTDKSTRYFGHAQEKFRSYENIEFRALDIERDPGEQQFEPRTFDVVACSHAIHASRDPRLALTRARDLLRPGGLLLLVEPTRGDPWYDLTIGLAVAVPCPDNGPRPAIDLPTIEGWRDLLDDLGFVEAADILGLDGDQAATPLAVTDTHPSHDIMLSCDSNVSGDRNMSFDTPSRGGRSLPHAVDHGIRRRTAMGAALMAAAPPDATRDEPLAADTERRVGPAPGHWLIFADRGGVADQVGARLARRGQTHTAVVPGAQFRRVALDRFELAPGAGADYQALLEEIARRTESPLRGVLHFWNLDAPPAGTMTTGQLDATLGPGCLAVIDLAQAISARGAADAPRLWIVTRDAQGVAAADRLTGAAQSPVWGLGRVVANEAPAFRTTLVDLSADANADELDSLVTEILAGDDVARDDEVAFRGTTRYAHRFHHVRDRLDCPGGDRRAVVGTRPYRLDTLRSGSLDSLTLFGVERVEPGPDEVRIQVAATGLNFSDIMKVLGLYPDVPPGPLPIGLECSGVISAVGRNVTRFRVGDKVVAVGSFCFATYVMASAAFVEPMPEGMGFDEAATLPVSFLTAYYALHHVGRIQRNESILIHSATGGVGLAAIQLARRAGAEIFTTAGTPEKREFLRSLGIPHVMDSRSLGFADEISRATSGRGVDVVLNSLAGDALVKSLDVLAPCGRFLEIGKRDIYADSRIGLRPFRKQISVTSIDMVAMQERPRFIDGLFREMMGDLASGAISPLPHRIFPVTGAAAAFRQMAQAKHIGKVIVSALEQKVRVRPPRSARPHFRADATYLITGGLGGFGLEIAQWLVASGARHLALVGRRGLPTAEQQAVIDALRSSGARIEIVQADVSREEDVARMLESIAASLPPLRGIFHTAMVLNDCLLGNLNEERMREVWAPKVSGAWNLHRRTLDAPLDFFVLFSSLACVLGSPGQANYSAANAFLDGLAEYRRALGLPATTISWGFLSDVGWLSRHGDIAQRVKAQGISSFSPREALGLLGQFIVQGPTTACVLNMDWRRWGVAIGRSTSPKFAHLIQESPTEVGELRASATMVRGELLSAGPERRATMLENILRQRVARILGIAPDRVDAQTPLSELGLDSLMGIEIKNWIESELRLNVSTVELMKGPTVMKLVDLLLVQLAAAEMTDDSDGSTPRSIATGEVGPTAGEGMGDGITELVDDLSEDEVDALLQSLGSNSAANETAS